MDLLRYIPGVAFNQSGSRRRCDQPVPARRQFQYEPGADRWRPGEQLRRRHSISRTSRRRRWTTSMSIRGAQSAVYGSYANTGAIDFVTRRPAAAPQLSLLAEGGSHSERRFGDHRQRHCRRLRPAGLGVALRYRWVGGQQRLPQRRRAAECHPALRPAEALAARLFRFQRGGPAGPLGLRSEAHLYRASIPSAAPRTTSPSTARTMRSISRRACARNCSAASFCTTAASRSPYGFSFNKDLRGTGRGAHHRQPVARTTRLRSA